MEDLSKTLQHYTFNAYHELAEYNKKFAVPYYIQQLLVTKKKNKIADVGSGLVCRLGGIARRASVEIYASDILQPEYKKLLDKLEQQLVIPVEYQDVQKLTYEDDFFDEMFK